LSASSLDGQIRKQQPAKIQTSSTLKSIIKLRNKRVAGSSNVQYIFTLQSSQAEATEQEREREKAPKVKKIIQ
jgi:hypothetical protein